MTTASASKWTYLTHHAHVLVCLQKGSGMRIRDISDQVGITERMVQLILSDLEAAGVVVRHKSGRRNVYEIRESSPLRHPLEGHKHVSDLLSLVDGPDG